MSTALLTKEQERRLAERLGDKTTIFATSVARLYVAGEGRWRYTGVIGIIALVLDRETKARSIRIYGAENLAPRFQAEIPVDPAYVVESEYFHTLELENDVLGFMFALARENAGPHDKNATLTSEARRFANKVSQFSLKAEDEDLKFAKEKAKQSNVPSEGPKRKGSIAAGWSKIKSTAKSLVGSSGPPPAASVVGTPTDFQHLHHIGLNKDGTMDISNVPDEWKDVLKMAGITKKDMKNPEVNKTVVTMLGSLIPTSGAKGSPGPKVAPKQMMALYDYRGASARELTIEQGEPMAMLKAYPDGWAKVQKQDGSTGMVPLNYLQDTGSSAEAVIPVRGESPTTNTRKSAAPPPPRASAPPPPRTSAPPRAPPPPNAGAAPNSTPTSNPAASVASPAMGRAPPPRPSPPTAAAVAPPKKVVISTPVEEPVEEEQPAEEPAEDVSEPDIPRPPKNPLLAGIQGFNKEALNRSDSQDEDRPARPPANPLLASIQGFNAQALSKAAETPKAAAGGGGGTPNPLDAIKMGNFQLKKVDNTSKPPEPPKQVVQPEMEGIAGLLKAKLANIRLGVKEEDDDDDAADSDWD